jgi:hypothetical protein
VWETTEPAQHLVRPGARPGEARNGRSGSNGGGEIWLARCMGKCMPFSRMVLPATCMVLNPLSLFMANPALSIPYPAIMFS